MSGTNRTGFVLFKLPSSNLRFLRAGSPKPNTSIVLDLNTYKSIVNGIQKVVDVVKAGKAKFEGNIKDLEKFVAIFDPLFVYKKEAKPLISKSPLSDFHIK